MLQSPLRLLIWPNYQSIYFARISQRHLNTSGSAPPHLRAVLETNPALHETALGSLPRRRAACFLVYVSHEIGCKLPVLTLPVLRDIRCHYMIITTFISPTVGCGRTTAVMALASALLETGAKVAVLDMTEHANGNGFSDPSPLTAWEQLMPACGYGFDQFKVEEIYDFESMIRALCYLEVDDFNTLLVDTSANTNELVLNMVGRSNIVVAPFQDPKSAVDVSDWLKKHTSDAQQVIGLVSGVEDEVAEQIARSAFTDFPTFENELPFAPLFQEQARKGHLFSIEHEQKNDDKTTLRELLS